MVIIGLAADLLTQPRPMTDRHRHHEVELNFLFTGSAAYWVGGERHELAPGRIAAFWGAVPHSLVDVAPGTEIAWITLPLTLLFEWRLPAAFIRQVMAGKWIDEAGGAPRRYPFREWAGEIKNEKPSAGAPVLLELQAALTRIASQPATSRSRQARNARTGQGQQGHVERMARHIATHFTEELTATDVARAAGLNSKYAMEVFKRACGMTIHAYLNRLRITHAQRLLIESDAKVLDVALACGFQSLSAFYAAFAAEVGQTPRAYRARFDGAAMSDDVPR